MTKFAAWRFLQRPGGDNKFQRAIIKLFSPDQQYSSLQNKIEERDDVISIRGVAWRQVCEGGVAPLAFRMDLSLVEREAARSHNNILFHATYKLFFVFRQPWATTIRSSMP